MGTASSRRRTSYGGRRWLERAEEIDLCAFEGGGGIWVTAGEGKKYFKWVCELREAHLRASEQAIRLVGRGLVECCLYLKIRK